MQELLQVFALQILWYADNPSTFPSYVFHVHGRLCSILADDAYVLADVLLHCLYYPLKSGKLVSSVPLPRRGNRMNDTIHIRMLSIGRLRIRFQEKVRTRQSKERDRKRLHTLTTTFFRGGKHVLLQSGRGRGGGVTRV